MSDNAENIQESTGSPESGLGTDPTEETTFDPQKRPEQTLGVDDVPSEPAPAAPATPSEPEPTPAETTPEVTKEVLEELQSKAAFYDVLDQHPEVVGLIDNFFKKLNTKDTPTPNTPVTDNNNSPDITAMQQELADQKRMVQGLANQLAINAFRETNPGFNTVQKDVGELMSKHPTLSLQEAFEFVNAKSAKTTPDSKVPAALQSSETSERPTPDVSYADLEAKLADPNKTQSVEDALKDAFKLAMLRENE